MIIKSLKQINEFEDRGVANALDRYSQDLKAAREAYQKEDPGYGPLSRPAIFRNPSAAYDKHLAEKNALERLKASLQGKVSQADQDEQKFQLAKAAAKSFQPEVSQKVKSVDLSSSASKISSKLGEHTPSLVAGSLLGLAAIAALKKRKQHLPSPSKY